VAALGAESAVYDCLVDFLPAHLLKAGPRAIPSVFVFISQPA